MEKLLCESTTCNGRLHSQSSRGRLGHGDADPRLQKSGPRVVTYYHSGVEAARTCQQYTVHGQT